MGNWWTTVNKDLFREKRSIDEPEVEEIDM